MKRVVSVMCYFIYIYNDTYTCSAPDQVIDLKSIAGGMRLHGGLMGSGRVIPGKCHEGRMSLLN